MSSHYNIGDIIDVRVEKIVPRGFGLAFAEKLTVLVPLAAPGDELRVRISSIKKRLAFADIVEIIKPGPNRNAPLCEYFGTCGGCNMQQMSYPAQLEAKVGMIRDCLVRIGKIDSEAEINIVASPHPFDYRSRARWHLDGKKQQIGYFQRDSHSVIDVHACPILTPGLQSTLEYIRESMDWSLTSSEQAEIEAASGEEGRVSIFSTENTEPVTELSFSVNGDTYAFSAELFFQANKFLIPELIAAALGDMRGESAFDLYCGVGLFTLPLARRFGRVTAVEEDRAAVSFANKNVTNAGLHNVNVVGTSVVKFLEHNKTKKADLILIDPPRSGTEPGTIEKIARLRPLQISYISCEPSILARDLRILIDAGYVIENITAIDLFPQTHHVETVVRLHR